MEGLILKQNVLQKVFILGLSFMLLALTAGQSINKEVFASSETKAQTKQTLKVVYKAKSFFNEKLFKEQFPNVEIQEVVWDGKSDFKAFTAKHSPDVVMLDHVSYQKLSKENQLADLGQLIKRDGYNTETIYPGLLDALKINGKLYGLSPIMDTTLLFYNADLFKKYNVELPKDGMTWEEILKLAAKFPTKGNKDTRVWGLYYPLDQYNYLINEIGQSEGLTFYDHEKQKAMINTAAWKKVYSDGITAIKSNTIEGSSSGGIDKDIDGDAFVKGRAAMTVQNSAADYIRLITFHMSGKSRIPNYKPFTVKTVAGPADSKNKKTTRNVMPETITAISSSSTNKELAWEFIKFYNGVDYAEYITEEVNSSYYTYILTRMDFNKEYKGLNLEAIYKLKPNMERPIYFLQSKGSLINFLEYQKAVQKEINSVISNKKTIDKALESIQKEVQKGIDNAVKKQKEKK